MTSRFGLAVATLLLVVACGQPPATTTRTRSEPEHDPPPQWLVDSVVGRVVGLSYEGEITEVYGTGTATLGEWKALEPGYTSAIEVTPENADDPVYAVFFKGDIRWIPDPTPGVGKRFKEAPPGSFKFKAGRFVFDAEGSPIAETMWSKPKDATPPFGPHLDDR